MLALSVLLIRPGAALAVYTYVPSIAPLLLQGQDTPACDEPAPVPPGARLGRRKRTRNVHNGATLRPLPTPPPILCSPATASSFWSGV
jgi:hypothetical protein